MWKLAEFLETAATVESQVWHQESFALIASEDREKLGNIGDDAYPLSQLQAGMLFHGEYSQSSTTYHDVFSFRIRIPFNLQVWEQAYTQMFARHRVLRTAFYLAEFSRPIQVVVKNVPAKVIFTDLTNLSASAQDDYIKTFIDQERRNRFDYQSAPLMRFHVHQLDENVMEATFTLHHAIMDGWSLANFLAELTGLYLHLMDRGVPALPPAPNLEYSRFIALEQEALKEQKQREFWQQQLTEIPFTKIPRLPVTVSPTSQSSMGKVDITLSDTISQGLKDVSHQLGVPLRTVLLALHLHILAVVSGEEEVVTGLVSNGRPDETDSDRILGLFLNTLPLRLKLPHGSWVDLIKETWRAEQVLMPNRRFPLAELQRINGNQPFYETSFNFVHFHVYKGLLNWREVELIQSVSLDETNIPFAVSWSEEVATVNISLNITYNSQELTESQITTIANYYQTSAELLSKNPRVNREYLPTYKEIFTYDQLELTPIHEIVNQQATVNPDAIAVVCEGEVWTYQQLNQKANQLARFLQKYGISPEKPVGICLERSLDMVCAMLGVLKAGGCYVPIDPHYPTARIQSMLDDGKVNLLLTRSELKVNYGETICLDIHKEEIANQATDNLKITVFPDNIAYIIFTSGSTGRPKGVAVSHQALAYHQNWFLENFAVSNNDVVLQKTPFSFDASVW